METLNTQPAEAALERLGRLYHEMCAASVALCEATAEELPVGTVIAATLGRSRVVGKVIGHFDGWSAYYAGTVIVENMRTGKARRVAPYHSSYEVEIISKPNTKLTDAQRSVE